METMRDVMITRKFNFILLPFAVFLFVFTRQLGADTLYLKNGHSIEGLIRSEGGDFIELEVCSGKVKFRKSEIEKIKKTSPEESFALRQKWERQKLENQEKALKRQFEEAEKPKRIEFSQDAQGIILAVTLNKKVATSLVLDTGASLVVLKKDVAKKLKIDLDKVVSDAKLILADGRQVKAKRVILESVKVEDVEAKDVEAAVMLDEVDNFAFADGLLGMSFLRRFNFKVDQKDKRLVLEKL